MSLTPPPLRSGSVPAQEFSHGGHGGSAAAPHRSPQQERVWGGAAALPPTSASHAREIGYSRRKSTP